MTAILMTAAGTPEALSLADVPAPTITYESKGSTSFNVSIR